MLTFYRCGACLETFELPRTSTFHHEYSNVQNNEGQLDMELTGIFEYFDDFKCMQA